MKPLHLPAWVPFYNTLSCPLLILYDTIPHASQFDLDIPFKYFSCTVKLKHLEQISDFNYLRS